MLARLGGGVFVNELRAAARSPDAQLNDTLLRSVLGCRIWATLREELEPALQIGNVLFVHAGIDPTVDLRTYLSMPRDRILRIADTGRGSRAISFPGDEGSEGASAFTDTSRRLGIAS